jgi:nicotinamide mononucleotide transporter
VYLTTRQLIWCWPFNMLGVALYAGVFFQARLYANMGLQVVYFALAAYGWWAWLHGGEDEGELRVRRVSGRTAVLLLSGAAVAGLLLSRALGLLTDASLPLLDALLTAFSIGAQWMQARKLLENWLLWIAVDVVYIGVFLYVGLFATAALYVSFLVLATMGFLSWRASMTRPPLPAPGPVAR